MLKRLMLGIMVMALVFGSAGSAAAAPAGNGTVTVIHGVPGLVVDVYVNGALTLPSFAPYTVTQPLSLPQGNYNIAIVPAGGNPANPAISGSAFLPAGANVSIVAHLTAAGAPTLSVYVNNLSRLRFLQSRLIVRHTAQAPAVDVRLYREVFKFSYLVGKLSNLSNPNEKSVDVFAGSYSARLFPAGGSTAVFGPASLNLPRQTVTIVYAVGSLSGGTFRLLTQTIRLPSGW